MQQRCLNRRELAALLAGGAAALAGAPRAKAQSAGLDALVGAARAEGGLVFYSSATDNIDRRIVDAFAAKYGIKPAFTRLSSSPLQQRFDAEAEAGSFASDLQLNAGNNAAFVARNVEKGWMDRLDRAGIPVLEAGTYPARFNRGTTALVQIAPWGIAYNTDRVKPGEIPRDVTDILKPRFKGEILLADPASSDAYLDFWAVVLDAHGEDFFTQFRALNPRHYDSGVPATQALGAGEGSIQLPTVSAQVGAVKDKGAPIDMMVPDATSGVEMQLLLTARAHARHPAAARLFANWLLSEEGNRIFNDDPSSISIYDTARLPRNYVAPKPETVARRGEFRKLLGFS